MNLRPLLFVLCTTASFFVISHFTSVNSLSQKLESNRVKTELASKAVEKPTAKTIPINLTKGTRRLALENKTMQLVFSPESASLAEINLPIDTLSDESVIHSTDLDKSAERLSLINTFPLLPTASSDGKSLKKSTGGYYPLIRRGNIEAPANNNCHGVRLYSNQKELVFKPTQHTKDAITFCAHANKTTVFKTYRLNENLPYSFDVDIEVKGPMIDLHLGVGGLEAEPVSKKASPTLSYKTIEGDKIRVESLTLPKSESSVSFAHADWISCSNGFFGMVVRSSDPFQKGLKLARIENASHATRLSSIDPDQQKVSGDLNSYFMSAPVQLKEGKASYQFYTGPFHRDVLSHIDHVVEKTEGQNPEVKSASSFFGFFSFISEPFSRLLLVLINFFHGLTGSWGLSIILLTIALRVMLYPLNAWAIRSNIKMRNLSPELAKLKERYSKDPRKANMEQVRLFKERGVNPLSGCFIQLLQLPFLFGMFDLLKTTFQLRGASFIPGWINDLAAPDVLFTWGYSFPLIGNEFHLLPILNALGMLVQHKLMTAKLPKDPNEWTDQQRQQKVMSNVFVVFIAFIFYNMPSGLNLYFIFSLIFSALQQWLTERSMNKKAA